MVIRRPHPPCRLSFRFARAPLPVLAGGLFASLLLFFSAVSAEDTTPRQSEETFSDKAAEPQTLNYLLYLPKDYRAEEKKKWPLLVFLHGSGERGDNLDKVKIHGPPKRVEAGDDFPFIIASPQCPADSWWSWEPVDALIDDLAEKLRVDPGRVYLTGLSMGGYGTWSLASQRPDRFAAIVPICGGGTPYLMQRLRNMPVWVFHGGKDNAVSISESQRLVDALKKAGNTQTKFTIYPEAGHNSWTAAYDDPALYEWLLAQKRGTTTAPKKP